MTDIVKRMTDAGNSLTTLSMVYGNLSGHNEALLQFAALMREGRDEIERLQAALQSITDLCKTSLANPFLADDMDRIARRALENKP